MKVTLAEHGGLAGGLRLGRPPLVVDVSTLPVEEARALTELLSAVRAGAPPDASARSAPDGMSYTVTIEDGGEPEVLRRTDTTMSQEFADLVGRLQRLARGC